jgi:hypothetical protein
MSVNIPVGQLGINSSLDVQFLLGVLNPGSFKFYVNIEALP